VSKDKDISHESASIARGYVNHEAAHNRYSNMVTIKRFARHPDHHAMLQGMEDARIEAKFAKAYPGSRQHFEATAGMAAKMFNKKAKKGEIDLTNKKGLLPYATAWKGRELGWPSD
jgi:cobalamin biosynthesis protein CobT